MDKEVDALRDFQTFLSQLGTVPENKTKFYLHWVRRFLKFCNYQVENINKERVAQYLDSLDAEQKIADSQVKQAANGNAGAFRAQACEYDHDLHPCDTEKTL